MPAPRPVRPHPLDQPTERRLRRAVAGGAGESAVAGEARDHHDVAGPALPHRGDDGLDGVERAEDVHAELLLQHVRVGRQRVGPARDPGVGDQEVDRTEPLRQRADRGVDLVAPGDVRNDPLRAGAGSTDRCREVVEPAGAAGRQPDVAALMGELQGEGPPDAARRPRDYRDSSHRPADSPGYTRILRGWNLATSARPRGHGVADGDTEGNLWWTKSAGARRVREREPTRAPASGPEHRDRPRR